MNAPPMADLSESKIAGFLAERVWAAVAGPNPSPAWLTVLAMPCSVSKMLAVEALSVMSVMTMMAVNGASSLAAEMGCIGATLTKVMRAMRPVMTVIR